MGDDVLGEDPTVKKLEAMAAERFGKEKGLFVTSGTMANQVTVMTLCHRGDQIIVHNHSHIYNLEVGGLASTCSVQPRAVHAPGGYFDLDELIGRSTPDIQRAPTTLICLENSFDLNRGLAVPREHIEEVCPGGRFGQHLHGRGPGIQCRHFSGHAVDRLKGRGCGGDLPVKGARVPRGFLIMGDAPFIDEARRMRQRVGGGWRQAGILAAAGILALEEMIERLAEDHERPAPWPGGLLPWGWAWTRTGPDQYRPCGSFSPGPGCSGFAGALDQMGSR